MVANAILELWKKETGSLSPVIIEGTICITAGSGRTTVVQVSNHFSGSIPDSTQDDGPMYHTPKRKMMSHRHSFHYPHFDMLGNPPVLPPYFEELSPASLTSPSLHPSLMIDLLHKPAISLIAKKSRYSNVSEQSMDVSSVKEESVTDEDEKQEDCNVERSADSSMSRVIPGTGFYVEEDIKEKDAAKKKADDDEKDLTDDSRDGETEASLDKGPLMSTPKSIGDGKEDADALDLSHRKEEDLALSPPQNYTAQVRSVIRQRLLASQHGLLTANATSSQDEDSPLALSAESGSLPPLMNLNLNSAQTAHYGSSIMSKGKSLVPPLQDILSRRDMALLSPELYSPNSRPASAPIDQNGNDKETLYTSEKGEAQKVYRCNFCSKTFLFKSKYYEHLPVHTNVRPFQCHLCSRTYKYKYDLRVHLRTHMGIPTKSTVCPFCTVKFDTNKLLRLHIQEFHHASVALPDQNSSGSQADVSGDSADMSEELSASI